jgi:hydrogenase-4 component E
MLYQDRLYSLLNVYAVHALVLAASVAWQAFIQDAPHLYVTAGIALVFKAIVIPVALHRIIVRLGIHREIEKAVGIGPDHARRHRPRGAVHGGDAARNAGCRSVGARGPRLRAVGGAAGPLDDGDAAQRGEQVVGFMSLENGLVLAATGAKGMPLVVEISVAFSVLIAFIVIGIFLFRIRERFDTVDVQALDRFQGERR